MESASVVSLKGPMLFVLIHKSHGIQVCRTEGFTLSREDIERLQSKGWIVQVPEVVEVRSIDGVKDFVDQAIYAAHDPSWRI